LALHGNAFTGPITVTSGRFVVGSTATVATATVSGTGVLVVRGSVTGPVTLSPTGVLVLHGGTIGGLITASGATVRGSGAISGANFQGVNLNPGTGTTVGTITTSQDVTLDPTTNFVVKIGSVAAVLVS